MADAETTKKYYWLKLKRDFFKRHDIRIVEEMPNGKDYALFYLKMLVESIDHEGELRFSETIPYNEQMLSVITNTNIDIVRSAMKLFIELKMIDLFDDKTIYMSEVQKMIGNETAGAERVRKHRAGIDETKRLLQCNTDVTKSNTEKETDTELKKDTKLDTISPAYPYGMDTTVSVSVTDTVSGTEPVISKKPVKHKYGEFKNVLLTDSDLEKLQAKFSDWAERIESLSCGIENKGYVYKNHLLTIRNWAKRDAEKGKAIPAEPEQHWVRQDA